MLAILLCFFNVIFLQIWIVQPFSARVIKILNEFPGHIIHIHRLELFEYRVVHRCNLIRRKYIPSVFVLVCRLNNFLSVYLHLGHSPCLSNNLNNVFELSVDFLYISK